MSDPNPQGALAAALAKAQAQMTVAREDGENPHFRSRFATLASVIDAVRGPLTSNGIAFTQAPGLTSEGVVTVETTFHHIGGGSVSCTAAAKPKQTDPQSIGSAITYLRRYGLLALAGIAPGEDDDGEAATRHQQQSQWGRETELTPHQRLGAALKAQGITVAQFNRYRNAYDPPRPGLTKDLPADAAEGLTRWLGEGGATSIVEWLGREG